MNDAIKFQKIAAVSSIISAPLAILSVILPLIAVDFNFKVFTDTLIFLYTGNEGAVLWRWGMILDILGYYLLNVPLYFFLWRWLKSKGENQVTLFTFCLLFYSILGSIGASILASVLPPIISTYSALPVAEQTTSQALFSFAVNAVYTGLWNLLEELVAGVGWLGIGLLLRKEFPAVGTVTVILGSAALLCSLATILQIGVAQMIGLNLYLLLVPIWAFWLGIILLKNPIILPDAKEQ